MVAQLARVIPEFYTYSDHALSSKLVPPADIGWAGSRQHDHAAAVHMIHAGQRARHILGRMDIEIDVVAIHALDELGAPLHSRNRWEVREKDVNTASMPASLAAL